jgi:hypothetical protein
MSDDLELLPPSALDLEFQGSIGRFVLSASQGGDASPEVVYLQTHLGFERSASGGEKLLKHLAPVREVFDFSRLSFGEIMQRDIDDARVSTEMIPYLLDPESRGLVKFFPPIVVVALPVKDGEPLEFYPTVSRCDLPTGQERRKTRQIRSGEIGDQSFQFEYPLLDSRELLFDQAKLKLNSDRIRLVIIDGQHRAMALLALHRNLNDDWDNQSRAAFKSYYAEWTKERIRQRNLSGLQLPVVICTFPTLDKAGVGGLDVVRACRSLFLTLNKTARAVSSSRNILLDDRDLISHFLRGLLEQVKARNIHAMSTLRIWNVELDQYRDRVALETAVACTGISHVYYMIEHLMFAGVHDVQGVGARSGKFHKRQLVEQSLLLRLDGEACLGGQAAEALGRHSFTMDAADKLYEQFRARYGECILRVYDDLYPMECHNRATMDVFADVSAHGDRQVRAILFEGQGIERTFREYLAHMVGKERLAKDKGGVLAPEVDSALASLRSTQRSVDEFRRKLYELRAEKFVASVADKAKLRDSQGGYGTVAKRLNPIFDDVFFTVAFQSALVCGFFQVYESAVQTAGSVAPARGTAFTDYLNRINEFFKPTTAVRCRDLISVFDSDLEGDRADEWTASGAECSFRQVVARGEMKPDEWPKYRYLLLELWSSAEGAIRIARDKELETCRLQVFSSLYKRNRDEKCSELSKKIDDLSPSEVGAVATRTFAAIDGLLSNLGVPRSDRWSKEQYLARMQAKAPVESAAEGEV